MAARVSSLLSSAYRITRKNISRRKVTHRVGEGAEEAVGVINYFYVVVDYGELFKTSFKIIRSVIKAIRNFGDESSNRFFVGKFAKVLNSVECGGTRRIYIFLVLAGKFFTLVIVLVNID